MKPADLFRKLSSLGLDPDQIAGVMEIMDEEAEGRKEKARARWHKWNDKKDGSNVSKRLLADANVSSQLTSGDARGENNLPTKKITGQEENKKEAPQATPRRATRLPADWQIPEPWLLEAIAAGFTRAQAVAEARTMHNWSLSDRNGAKLDWLATWRNWFARANRPRGQAPPGKRNYADVINDKLDEANGQQGIFGDRSDAQRFSPRLIESRPDHENVRGGIAGRIVGINR